MKKLIAFALACFTLTAFTLTALSQSTQQLKRDMYGIASDATEGRFTGSPGYLKAAHYVAGQLRRSGIETRLQAVPFIWDNYNGSSITINHKNYLHEGGNFVVLRRSGTAIGGWIVLREMPDSAATEHLVRRKMAGVIVLPNEQQASDWETTVIRQYRFGYMHYAADYSASNAQLNVVLISPVLAGRIKSDPKPIVKLSFIADSVNGYNVIAKIPGTDKSVKDQVIIAGAHLDHIGRCGTHIYNGANDDASGCVALMNAARYFGQHRAGIPLMLVFYCGEELNLLGSRYFMDHPPVPVKNIRMNINLEQIGSKHRSFQGVWALGDLRFQKDFFESGGMFDAADLKFTGIDSVREVLSNTDSYSFMKKDVPSLLLGSGGFDEHHTTADKIDLIDFPHLQKAGLLLCRLLKTLADQK